MTSRYRALLHPKGAALRRDHTSAGPVKTESIRNAIATKSNEVNRISSLSDDSARFLLTVSSVRGALGKRTTHCLRQARLSSGVKSNSRSAPSCIEGHDVLPVADGCRRFAHRKAELSHDTLPFT